jgi:hypothetical protein
MNRPPIYSKKHSAEFLGKYEKNAVYIENSVWIAEKKRKYTKALEFLKDFVKLEPAKLESSGIPSNIAKAMQNCKISNNLNLLLNDKKLSIVLRERYFSKIV